jgi:hypothetical protein
MNREIKNMAGQRYGKLFVLEYFEYKNRHHFWKCACDCGNEKIVRRGNLMNGHVKSCGCIGHYSPVKHGLYGTDIYGKWDNMIARCKPNSTIKRYLEKGISVCKEWKSSFINFKEWSFESGYKEGLSLDRIDNSKGYCPENCRWVTMKQQQNNRTNNVIITLNEETHTLSEWADKMNVKYSTFYGNYKRHGNKYIEKLIRREAV